MARLSTAALAVALLVACKDGAKKEQPAPERPAERIHLYADEELDKLERALTERLAENRARMCPRPVLRGTATPGPALAEMQALTEPKGGLADCLSGGGTDCGAVAEAALVPIGQHEDGCSTFQPGRHVMFVSTKQVVRVAELVAAHAKARAVKDPKGGLWLLAESLRAFQDLSRGHVDLVAAQTATAGYEILLAQVEDILARAKLRPADAKELATAFEALVLAEPRWGDALQGQLDHVALYQGLARMEHQGWEPPGGTTPTLAEESKKPLAPGSKMLMRDQAGLVMQSSIERAKDYARECTPTTGYTACIAYLELIAKERARMTRDDAALVDPDAYYAKLRASGKDDEAARTTLREVALETAAVPLHFDYADHGRTKARVVWRLVAAQHALAARASNCDAPPGTPGVALLGEPVVTKHGNGVLEITPPAVASHTDLTPWRTACP